MPASSITAMNSWGIYLISALTLLVFLTPVLSSTARNSREGADWRNADGVRAVLDSLRPGMTVPFSFGDSASTDPILLGDHFIACSYGVGTIRLSARFALPDFTLLPEARYLAKMDGVGIEVIRTG